MWNDSESLSDYIDYTHLVKAVTSIIDNDNLLPCSIGVFGDWGSGKSSLMRMVEKRYEKESDVLVITFNGWLFEGYDDAKTVLMGRIVDEIISKRKLNEKAIKFAAKLLKRVDWLKLAGSTIKYGASLAIAGPIGLGAAALHEMAGKISEVNYEDYIKEKQNSGSEDLEDSLRNNIQEFHKNFENLIAETEIKKIIVFIDDLDRCSSDTVIGTLEAIKLFLFTNKTAFIIGADERLIKYAVRKRFPEVVGENIEVGRDYLEKLIQFPIRIPPLNIIELTTYINMLFSQLYCSSKEEFERCRGEVIEAKQNEGFEFTLDQSNATNFFNIGINRDEFADALALCSQIVPVLSTGLNGNPRQAKRFLNALLLRIIMASSKGTTLKRRVLAKLMLLEYFKPETFTSFHDIQSINDGRIPIISKLENVVSQPNNFGESDNEQKDIIKNTSEENTLLEDDWINKWIRSEPKIGDENLQPYFYFSRDKLTISAVNYQRMTPKAQEVIQSMLSESKAIRNKGVLLISSLSSSEAASIFEAFTQKIRQEESLTNSNAFSGIFEIAKIKRDLISQVITFLTKFPSNRLPLIAATLSEALLKDTNPEALRHLYDQWILSSNVKLSNVVKNKIK